ncbi:MAG TPA: hypothetical protein VGJ41_02605 [Nocardioides sp.]|jgi:hypothetical protein
MTTSVPSADEARDPFARTASTRRVGLALAMLVAPWLIVVAETAHALTNPHGKDDIDPAVGLALTADHLTVTRWASLAAMLGALLLVPAVLGVMRLVRTRAARLGLVGGVLTATGYVCYFALVLQGAFTSAAMVTVGGSRSQDIDVLQVFNDDRLGAMWVGPLFVLGNIVGTFLLGLALVRARTAGRLAGYGVMAWAVLHVLSFSPFVEVVAAVAQAVGFALAAVALLRGAGRTHDVPEPYELLRR